MRRVLLMTASFGSGHNQAAYAVMEALKEKDAEVEVVDYVGLLNPALRSFAKFSLIQGVKRAPGLYGLFYKSMSRIDPDSALQRYVNHIGIERIQEYIAYYRPDCIASTFPTPMGVVGELRRAGKIDIPNLAIVTDYTAHRQWYHDFADHYFVATDEVKRDLVSYGIPADAVDVVGIPLRRKFREENVQRLLAHRSELIRSIGFQEEIPIILLMGGGSGILADPGVWESFIPESGMQYLIICGHNRRLERRFSAIQSERVRVFGYTNEIEKFMAMADLIVTKPGGLTLTESIAMRLPLLIYRPIPGQEEANARFAEQAGVAVCVKSPAEAQAFLLSVREDPSILSRMREACSAMPSCGAAERIAQKIMLYATKKLPCRSVSPEWPPELLPT